MYADVVAKPKSQNFRAYLTPTLREDLSEWVNGMGSSDTAWAERMAAWWLKLPDPMRMAIWRGWQLPPDSDMAKAILASLKFREADGERKIVSLTTPASLTPSSLRAPAPPLPTYTKGKSK
jgi:hypothetical protein